MDNYQKKNSFKVVLEGDFIFIIEKIKDFSWCICFDFKKKGMRRSLETKNKLKK